VRARQRLRNQLRVGRRKQARAAREHNFPQRLLPRQLPVVRNGEHAEVGFEDERLRARELAARRARGGGRAGRRRVARAQAAGRAPRNRASACATAAHLPPAVE
jgi:hypothetical protein